jgi:hypothetical protein
MSYPVLVAGHGEVNLRGMAKLSHQNDIPRRSSAPASTTSSASLKIERSNQAGKFTPEQLAAKVRESRAYWSSPAGIKRQAELDRENRNRKSAPAKFPSLASKGTKPAVITGADEALIARYI